MGEAFALQKLHTFFSTKILADYRFNISNSNKTLKPLFLWTALPLRFKSFAKAPLIVVKAATAQQKLLGRSKNVYEAAWSPTRGACFDLAQNLRSGSTVNSNYDTIHFFKLGVQLMLNSDWPLIHIESGFKSQHKRSSITQVVVRSQLQRRKRRGSVV